MLKQQLLEILNSYIDNKKLDFKGNQLAKKIRKSFPYDLSNILNHRRIQIKGSSGMAQWAEIPWIAFLDSKSYRFNSVWLLCSVFV